MREGKSTLTRTLLAGLLAIGLIFAATTALTVYNLRALISARQATSSARDMLDALDSLRQSIGDADAAQRGFLISGDTPDLNSYKILEASINQQIEALLRRAESEPLPQDTVARLRPVTMAALAELASMVRIRAADGFEAARRAFAQKTGPRALDTARALVEELRRQEFEVLGARRGKTTRNYVIAERGALITGILGLIGLLAFGLLARRQAAIQHALAQTTQRQREQLRVTLASIGDAVISTDNNGRVTFLNGIAEALTGWRAAAAQGQPLGSLFNVIDESTRLPLSYPVAGALTDAAGGEPINHRILISRNGDERLIESTLTPIRDDDARVIGSVIVFRDISERRASEKALRTAHEEVRLALKAGAIIGIWAWEIESDRVTTDANLASLFSVAPDEAARGLSIEHYIEAIDPDDIPSVRSAIETAVRDGQGLRAEFRLKGPSGPLWVEASGRVELAADGKTRRMPGVLADISDRKRAEEVLREHELQFQTLAQAMPNFAWITQPDGQMTWVNEWVHRYSGEPPETFRGDGWAVIVHPDDLPGAASRWANAVTSGESYETDFRLRRADGSYRWHLARALPVRGPDGAVRLWVGTNTDIEEQKAAVDNLADANERLEQQIAERTADRDRIWRLSTDVMLITRADGVITAANPAWKTALGWLEPELVGRSSFELIHPDDLEAGITRMRTLTEGSTLPGFSNRYRHKDGGFRWIAWTAVAGAGFVSSVGRDFTAEREQADALGAAQDALRQSQKMEAVGQLTGGLAHDFNNLLGAITGSLELVSSRISQGRMGEVDRYVGAAQDAARRAAALTHRLLAFSRRQSLEPKPTDVNRLVAGMSELIGRTVGPEIVIETIGAAGLWTALVDRNQLENALLNLCINARDAMPDGGRLTIETANKWLDERAARERDLPPGQYLSLCVTDTGTGMTPEVIAHAFDPFFTTKPLGMGTGLGLSMIYGFARQSNGQVRIYSELGHGTTMCLYLPRHHGEGAETEESPQRAAVLEHSAHKATVLVVDDEPTLRMLVSEVLNELGYNVIEAGDGAAGLKLLRSDAVIDLLITDVGLPGGINGRQVADGGREVRPDLKILFITGYAENAVIRNGHLDRGMQVLTKPFSLDVLAARISKMLVSD